MLIIKRYIDSITSLTIFYKINFITIINSLQNLFLGLMFFSITDENDIKTV